MRAASRSRSFVPTCATRTLVALGVLGLWCSAVHAGLTYSFTRVEAGSALPNNSSGRVWLDGDRARVEQVGDQVRGYTVLVAPGDGRVLALDTEERTYYERSPLSPLEMTKEDRGANPRKALGREYELRNVETEITEAADAEPIAGFATRKFELRLSYLRRFDYGSEIVRLHTSTTVAIWTTAELEGQPRILDPRQVRTELPEIDERIATLLDRDRVPGFPLKQELRTTRQFEGGPPVSRMSVLSFDDFATVETPATLFSLPDDYRYREPEFAAPGRGSEPQPVAAPSAAPASPSANRTSSGGGKASSRLPRFGVTSLDGRQISTEDLEGKVVLFDFWATWCKPCIDAIPHLRRLSRRRDGDPFVLIGVSVDEDEQALRKLVDDEKMTWTQIWDVDRVLATNLFLVDGYPTYVLFDHEGVPQLRVSGWGPDIAAILDRHVRKALRRAHKAAE